MTGRSRDVASRSRDVCPIWNLDVRKCEEVVASVKRYHVLVQSLGTFLKQTKQTALVISHLPHSALPVLKTFNWAVPQW